LDCSFHRREKEVNQEPPLVGIQVVSSVQACVDLQSGRRPKYWRGMRVPVFSFDMSVVDFSCIHENECIATGSFAVLKVPQDWPVQEFGVIIAVKAGGYETERGASIDFQSCEHPCSPCPR